MKACKANNRDLSGWSSKAMPSIDQAQGSATGLTNDQPIQLPAGLTYKQAKRLQRDQHWPIILG